MKKLLAGLGTVALAASLALVAPMSASAWHSTITSSVKCATTTSATITWTVQGYSDTDQTGTVTASTDGIVPTGTTFVGGATHDFTQVITAPGTYNLSVSMAWDSESATNTGGITVEKSDFDACYVPPVVPDKPTPIVTHASSVDAPDCEAKTVTTHHSTTTTDWTYSEDGNVWVKNAPVTVQDADTTTVATTEQCPPSVTNTQCEVITDGGTSTNLNANGWGDVDTRATGHAEYVAGGLKVYTEGATSTDKVSWGHALNVDLKDIGVVGMNYTGDFGIKPGINLFVNFGADGTGTLVQEDVYGTGANQDLWLTNGSSAAVKANAPVNGGGNGSQWHGTINQWLAKYPAAHVTGVAFSGGSGVYFSGVLHSITAGCTIFSFDFAKAVVVVPPTTTVVPPVTEKLAYTGAKDLSPWGVPIGGGALLLGLGLLVLKRKFAL